MEQLDGIQPQEYIEAADNAGEQISIQEKIADVITDELTQLSESDWRDKLPQIEELVIERLKGVGTPDEQINNMEYLDFVNLVIDALRDLNIIVEE